MAEMERITESVAENFDWDTEELREQYENASLVEKWEMMRASFEDSFDDLNNSEAENKRLKKTLKQAIDTFNKAIPIQQRMTQESVPKGFMEWAKTNKFNRPVLTTDTNPMSPNYLKVFPKRYSDGTIVTEEVSHYKAYQMYLEGAQRSRKLSMEETKTLEDAKRYEKQFGD